MACLCVASCAEDESVDLGGGERAPVAAAWHDLESGAVHDARTGFAAVERSDDRWAEAQIAWALTELLLLPESEGATALMATLGAQPDGLPLDVEGALYRPGGILDMASVGASEQLVTDAFYEALPWPRAALEQGPEGMFGELDPALQLEALRPGVVALEATLAEIDLALQAGLDGGFVATDAAASALYFEAVPRLRRSEAMVLLSGVRVARATIHLGLAYEWPMPLRAVLAERGPEGQVLDAAEVASLLNDGLFRSTHPDAALHLGEARQLAIGAVRLHREAMQLGRGEARLGRDGLIEWLAHDDAQAADLDALLASLEEGLDGAMPVPFGFAAVGHFWTGAAIWRGDLVRGAAAPPLFEAELDADTGLATVVAVPEGWQGLVVEPLFEPPFDPTSPPNFLERSELAEASWLDLVERFRGRVRADWNL